MIPVILVEDRDSDIQSLIQIFNDLNIGFKPDTDNALISVDANSQKSDLVTRLTNLGYAKEETDDPKLRSEIFKNPNSEVAVIVSNGYNGSIRAFVIDDPKPKPKTVVRNDPKPKLKTFVIPYVSKKDDKSYEFEVQAYTRQEALKIFYQIVGKDVLRPHDIHTID